jgi:hypothetical protein
MYQSQVTLYKNDFLEDPNIEIMLNTIVYSEKEKIRNFKLNQISEVHEITNEQNIF